MKRDNKYHPSSGSWDDFEKLPDVTRIAWKESKEDIWEKMEGSMVERQPAKVIFFQRPVFRYAVAAVLVLAMAIAGLMRFYSQTISTLPGEHLTVSLPDGSTVELNAASTLKYYPLWWSVERRLKFTGEAFFQVEKGNKFVVNSSLGQTKVLGTSFNIYSRDNDYRVNCVTGKVQVKAAKSKVILLPNDQAELNKAGSFYVSHEVKTQSVISWVGNEFFFTSVPLQDVIAEIERQYGVEIQLPESLDKPYTGNFSREQSVEEVLYLVSRSFGAKFVQKQEGEYQIIQNK